jgi:hypothetical protein
MGQLLSENERAELGTFIENNTSDELIEIVKSLAERPTGLDQLHALIGP